MGEEWVGRILFSIITLAVLATIAAGRSLRIRQWVQRATDRSLDWHTQQQHREWWSRYEKQVYQLAVGVLSMQERFPVEEREVINQAVSLVMEVERRKEDGKLFVLRTPAEVEG
jgi:hypothetical protein